MHGGVRQCLHQFAFTRLNLPRTLPTFIGNRKLASASVRAKASVGPLSKSRGVLRLSGADLIPFLQGLLTNDVNPLQAPGSQILYAALLNAQGRHLHDLFLHRTEENHNGAPILFADVDREALPILKKKLLMYKLRSAVDIADVSDEVEVWVNRDGSKDQNGRNWLPDPRLAELGLRTVIRKGEGPSQPEDANAFEQDFKRFRLSQGIAEGDTEMPHGQAMPLEYNMDALNAINYSKGCYVGQELIARTHHKGVVRKRLMPLRLEGTTPEINSGIVIGEAETEIGKLRASQNDLGIAHVRLKPALDAMNLGKPLNAGGTSVSLSRPHWWPESWGHEESS